MGEALKATWRDFYITPDHTAVSLYLPESKRGQHCHIPFPDLGLITIMVYLKKPAFAADGSIRDYIFKGMSYGTFRSLFIKGLGLLQPASFKSRSS